MRATGAARSDNGVLCGMQRTRAHRFTPVMTTLKDIVNEVNSRLPCAHMRARTHASPLAHARTRRASRRHMSMHTHARTHEAPQSAAGRVQSTVYAPGGTSHAPGSNVAC